MIIATIVAIIIISCGWFALQQDTSMVWEGLGGIWPPCEPWDRVREREREPSME